MRATLMALAVQLPALAAAPAGTAPAADAVRETERAFAQTMADRSFERFASFISDEAVFFGDNRVLRGTAEVAAAWKAFFGDPQAPFSWAPDKVEVLDSGGLAFSSGPVFDPKGQRIGTFNSVWRKEADGRWRIVFDKGCPPCP